MGRERLSAPAVPAVTLLFIVFTAVLPSWYLLLRILVRLVALGDDDRRIGWQPRVFAPGRNRRGAEHRKYRRSPGRSPLQRCPFPRSGGRCRAGRGPRCRPVAVLC